MKRNSLLLSALLLLLAGCATESTALNEYEQKLLWVNQANAEQDAEEAMRKGDFRLLALPGRGQVIPGIAPQQRAQYAMKCGTRLTPGVTDAVRGETHLRLLNKARDYAEQYNRLIKTGCSP